MRNKTGLLSGDFWGGGPYNLVKLHFLAFCLILGLVCQVWAGDQRVEIEKVFEANGTLLEQEQEMHKEAFTQAVVQEAGLILGAGTLSSLEQEVLSGLLAPEVSGLVLSFREQDLVAEKFYRKSVFIIHLNSLALQDWLKKQGLYYSRGQKLRLALDIADLNPDEAAKLETLVRLYGFVPDPASPCRLLVAANSQAAPSPEGRSALPGRFYQFHLQSRGISTGEVSFRAAATKPLEGGVSAEDHYTDDSASRNGSLDSPGKGLDLVVRGPDLTQLWLQVWADYLHRPEVRARLLSTLELEIKGWDTVAGVCSFSAILAHWYSLVDEYQLLQVHLSPDQVSALWKVRTVRLEKLRAVLQDFLIPRGLMFQVKGSTGT